MIHDQIVNTLEQRLRDSNYDLILSCEEYRVHRKYGECDLLGIRGDYAVVVEIKGRDKTKARRKAYQQLKKDIEWIHVRFPHVDRIFPFYSYANKQQIELEWYVNI